MRAQALSFQMTHRSISNLLKGGGGGEAVREGVERRVDGPAEKVDVGHGRGVEEEGGMALVMDAGGHQGRRAFLALNLMKGIERGLK